MIVKNSIEFYLLFALKKLFFYETKCKMENVRPCTPHSLIFFAFTFQFIQINFWLSNDNYEKTLIYSTNKLMMNKIKSFRSQKSTIGNLNGVPERFVSSK